MFCSIRPMASNEQLVELSSLGIDIKRKNEVDSKEVADLIDILKSTLYEDYKAIYNEQRKSLDYI
jgi:hypothetical protein